MENQVITPNQNEPNRLAPQSSPPAPPPAPVVPPTTGLGPIPDFNADDSGSSGKFGRLSLILSALAVGIFILLIFVSSLIDSLAKAYVWFFVILALGVAGLTFGLLSEKGKDRINLLGLVGIILSVIVCINCLIIGSYYIKIQIELNKFKSQTNLQLNNLDSNPYSL